MRSHNSQITLVRGKLSVGGKKTTYREGRCNVKYRGEPNPQIAPGKVERFESIFNEHFEAKGMQCVNSDDMIFLLRELSEFYFLSESNVRYTSSCNT